MKISTDLPSVGDILALGPIATVPVCIGGVFIWVARDGPLAASNQKLMLGAALIAFGFAAWRCKHVKGWHVYRHVYVYDKWAIATVVFWLATSLFFAGAVIAGRFPFLPAGHDVRTTDSP